jgi:NAD+ kinase
MSRKFQTVGLWGRFHEGSVAEPAAALVAHLESRGLTVLIAAEGEPETTAVAAESVHEADLAKRIDLAVAIGGDGTLLHAARHVAPHGVPLIGINRGRLGFLTDVLPEQMLEAVDAILGGDHVVETRIMLTATIGGAELRQTLLALNDIAIQKGETGRMLDFVTTVDGSYVNTHRGDGLIVATPTGSTAYALSCGGPIIQPNVDALVMVPICPHTLSDRPLVLTASSTVEVRVESDVDDEALVACDGAPIARIPSSTPVTIRRAEQTVTLLHPRDYNYYELLRSKLNWGRANRDGGGVRARR